MADLQVCLEKGRKAYEDGLALLQDMTGWTKIKEVNDVIGYTRETADSPIKTFKTQYFMNKPPEFCARYIYDNVCALNLEFQAEDIEDMIVTEKVNDQLSFFQTVMKPKPLVAGRDFVTLGLLLEMGPNTFADIGVSVDKDVPLKEGYVRAEIKQMLTLYEPIAEDASRTSCQVVMHFDPKGNVPSMVVNAILANTTTAYERIRDRVNSLPA